MPHIKRDKWGRIVPPMPSAPVDPSSVYTLRSRFIISPHPTRPLHATSISNLSTSIEVLRRVEPLGNMAAQRFICTAITGPECLKNRHLFAIAYDPLFVPVAALPFDNSEQITQQAEEQAQTATRESLSAPALMKSHPSPLLSRRLLTRRAFCHRYFDNECNVYEHLSDLQGKSIPYCYGAFVIKFPNRELEEDREVWVLLVDHIMGSCLQPTKIMYMVLSDSEKREISERVLQILQDIKDRGFLWPTVTNTNFIRTNLAKKVFAVDFSTVVDTVCGKGWTPGKVFNGQIQRVKIWLKEAGVIVDEG